MCSQNLSSKNRRDERSAYFDGMHINKTMLTYQNDLQIGLNSIVSATPDQISCALADEIVVLNLDTGLYHGLSGVGARIWQLVEAPIEVQQILDTLLDEYEVDAQRCEQDLLELLSELLAQKLLIVQE